MIERARMSRTLEPAVLMIDCVSATTQQCVLSPACFCQKSRQYDVQTATEQYAQIVPKRATSITESSGKSNQDLRGAASRILWRRFRDKAPSRAKTSCQAGTRPGRVRHRDPIVWCVMTRLGTKEALPR